MLSLVTNKTNGKTKQVDRLTNMDLLLMDCKECEYLTIFGFPHQLTWMVSDNHMWIKPVAWCQKCGASAPHEYALKEIMKCSE